MHAEYNSMNIVAKIQQPKMHDDKDCTSGRMPFLHANQLIKNAFQTNVMSAQTLALQDVVIPVFISAGHFKQFGFDNNPMHPLYEREPFEKRSQVGALGRCVWNLVSALRPTAVVPALVFSSRLI